jgi:hypothetical protein
MILNSTDLFDESTEALFVASLRDVFARGTPVAHGHRRGRPS